MVRNSTVNVGNDGRFEGGPAHGENVNGNTTEDRVQDADDDCEADADDGM